MAQDRAHSLAKLLKVPQSEPLSLPKVYVSDRPVRPVSDEHVEDYHAEPSFMTDQCETKPLLLTPAFVEHPAWHEGKTHQIVN